MQNHLRQYDNPDVHQKQSRARSWTIINESRFFRPFYKNRFYRDVNPCVTNADKLIVYSERKYSNIKRRSDANCYIVRVKIFTGDQGTYTALKINLNACMRFNEGYYTNNIKRL